jgi:hypothetical protein
LKTTAFGTFTGQSNNVHVAKLAKEGNVQDVSLAVDKPRCPLSFRKTCAQVRTDLINHGGLAMFKDWQIHCHINVEGHDWGEDPDYSDYADNIWHCVDHCNKLEGCKAVTFL